jgi:hypothetical protein
MQNTTKKIEQQLTPNKDNPQAIKKPPTESWTT